MAQERSSASPLAGLYAALIVYASLYPFAGWRDQGIAPWVFLGSAWPRYWSGFDLTANLLGYVPLGWLLALALVRSGHGPWRAAAVGTGAAAVLSLLLEAAQSYLPSRVASNLDFGLNALGAVLGALAVVAMHRMGWLVRWSRVRDLWFERDARGAMVLLLLWPLALLFPPAVPFGLGHVLERAEAALASWLGDTPFLEWLPLREMELQPLWPVTEALCVALGLLAPLLLTYCACRGWLRRALLAAAVAGVGVLASGLSAALTWGPAHAWAWIDPPVRMGAGRAAAGRAAAAGAAPAVRRAAADGAGGTAHAAQPGAGQPLLCADAADLGAGALHPLSRAGAVAGLAVARGGHRLPAGVDFAARGQI